MITCRGTQDSWQTCEDNMMKKVEGYLTKLPTYEDEHIKTRVSAIPIRKIELLLFTYKDPPFTDAKHHIQDELMKGLVLNAQLQSLSKLTMKKLAKKILLKFLEFFFKKFRDNIWNLYCIKIMAHKQRLSIGKK